MEPSRNPYDSDVGDEGWAFVTPYLILIDPDSPQRKYHLRKLSNALRWTMRTGSP